MSEKITLTLPKLGESIHSAKVVSWLKKVGERVEKDEALLEVTTDKVNSEIPAPVAGILKEILVDIDGDVEVGGAIAILEGEGVPSVKVESPICPLKKPIFEKKESFLSPAVLRLAEVEGVTIDTLKSLSGTGEGGRVTRQDLERYLSAKEKTVPSKVGEERIQMTGMRKAIADNMVRSFYEAPHASLVMEADVTETMALIRKEKDAFQASHGVKLTITTFIISALAKAIAKYPLINASLENETIIMKHYVNVGLAVHVEGGLLVPVIKHCQERNLVSIAKSVGELTARAREKKLSPDDVKEGTITLTNFGMTGALIGVPIIRYPEVAIIGVGTVQKRMIVREDDSMAVRQMVYLTLTFDHRIIDGIYGCEFLKAVKDNLEAVSF